MKTASNTVFLATDVLPVLLGFLMMVAGYTIAVKQALGSSDVKRRLKKVFLDSKFDPDCDPRAAKLVYGGALFELIGFIALAYLMGPAIFEGLRSGNR